MRTTAAILAHCSDMEKMYPRPCVVTIVSDDLRQLIDDLWATANAFANGDHTPGCHYWPIATSVLVEGTEDEWKYVGHPHMHQGEDCDEPHPCDCGLDDRITRARDVLKRRPEIWEQL